MKKMRFLPELAQFLKENDYIYTVRKYRYLLTDPYIEVDGVGRCQRARIGQICCKKDLESHVDKSGFKTADDWWKKIKELNKGYVGSYYMYEVTVEEKESK